jgi:Neuraminidase (sialidase)
MKFVVIIILCMSLILNGCSDNKDILSPTSTIATGNQTPEQNESTPVISTNVNAYLTPSVEQASHLLSSTVEEKTDGWFIYSAKAEIPGNVVVYHSTDTGKTWNRATLPTKQPWEQQVSKQNLFTSFPPTQQNLSGWVLLTSEPTAGLMGKTLYQSTDSGKSWQFLTDVSQTIDGYVTGVTFRDTQNGWITASQHGTVMLPLYRSKDGGNTWTLQTIDIPQNYKYGNVMPPSSKVEPIYFHAIDKSYSQN